MSTLNRALVKRAAFAASTALDDAARIADPVLRDAAYGAALDADDAANRAIWTIADADTIALEQMVADALTHAERVIHLTVRSMTTSAAS